MPATALPVVTSSIDGATWPATDGTVADVANFNSFTNGPNVCIVCTNSGASPYTVTFVTPFTVGGNPIDDQVKTLAAGERKVYGPLDNDIYGDTVTVKGSNAAIKFIVVQHT